MDSFSHSNFLLMDNVYYQKVEQFIAPQENVLFDETFFYQQQDMQLSPVTDYSSGKSTPLSSESLFINTNSSLNQDMFLDLEQNQEFFDNILKADISNEQMNEMLEEIVLDDQLIDFDNFTSDYSEYSFSAPTSANSTPKRKYSSSSSCYSYDLSDCSSPPIKKQRKQRKTLPDRKERKKEQNKKAAIKYREKKKNQQQRCNDDISVLLDRNSKLLSEVSSLQNELKVILPLATAAFNCNPYKKQQLQLLLERITPHLS